MAQIFTVAKGFFSKYKTIVSALEEAPGGSVIEIEPGIYEESIQLWGDITLKGTGDRDKTIIRASSSEAVDITNGTVHFENVTFQGREHGGNNLCAVTVNGGRGEFFNCAFTSDSETGLIVQAAEVVLTDCRVEESKLHGVLVRGGANVSVENSTFNSNGLSGVYVDDKSTFQASRSEFSYNQSCGIIGRKAEKIAIYNGSFVKNVESAVYIDDLQALIENSTFSGNGHTSSEGFGYYQIKGFNSHVTLSKILVEKGEFGGIVGEGSSKITINDSRIIKNAGLGVYAVGETEVAVASTVFSEGGSCHICTTDSVKLTVEKSELQLAGTNAVLAKGNSNVTLEHTIISENGKIEEDGSSYYQLAVIDAALHLKHTTVKKGIFTGIAGKGKGRIKIENSTISENKETGLMAQDKAEVEIADTEFIKNERHHLCIQGSASLALTGSKLQRAKENAVYLQEEGTVEIVRSYVAENGRVKEDGSGYYQLKNSGGKLYLFSTTVEKGLFGGVALDDSSKTEIVACDILENKQNNLILDDEAELILTDSRSLDAEVYNLKMNDNSICKVTKSLFAQEDTDMWQKSRESRLIMEQEQTAADPKYAAQEEAVVEKPLVPTLSDVLAELDELIGMERLKTDIRETIRYIEFNKELEAFGLADQEGTKAAASHIVLKGNPGTGKTTAAKLFGKLYAAMGLLDSGHVVEVNREKLVGEYIGHTAPQTQEKIDEAEGGILFIDEAYELTNKDMERDFGHEAVALLLEEMENKKGRFIVVAAGYQADMDQFLESNPGLKSRFSKQVELEDYDPDELIAIAEKIAGSKKRLFTEEAAFLLKQEFLQIWRKRDQFFGNGRMVRNTVEKIIVAQAQRCMNLPKEQWTADLLQQLTEADVEAAFPSPKKENYDMPIQEEELEEALAELDELVGLEAVKSEVRQMVTLVRFYKEEGREIRGLSPHTILKGNPGTGKTVVARIIAKIYSALGILERGDLIEVDRNQLVGRYQGESEKNIRKAIDLAMGGVLFIDEAYQLTQYGSSDQGHNIIEVLLKYMEDSRDQFIVLAAGYEKEMEQFAASNPGLKRRFNRSLTFHDYNPEELLIIAENIARKNGYQISGSAASSLQELLSRAWESRDHTFGNAGYARTLITNITKKLDYRIALIPKEERHRVDNDLITKEDIEAAVK
ncbi:MAG: AAA family ATPase [Alkalicoccus sp.]|nr:MAG: AAA family ATPase [Alkalicoccus sp.]